MWQSIRDLKALMRRTVLTEFLLILLISSVLVYFLQIAWKRRKLYKESLNLPGPLALPLIGSALSFIGSPYDIFNTINKMFSQYPPFFRVWFGFRMFYAVSDAKYMEIILTSPQALRKEFLYSMAEPVVGQGLFTARSVTTWRKHRKMIMPTFNQRVLDKFMEVFVEQSEILTEVLSKYSGKGKIDVFKVVSACTLDIICETAMGVQMDTQSADSQFSNAVDKVMEIVMMRIFNIIYHSEFIFRHSKLGKEFQEAIDQIRNFSQKVLTEKKLLRTTNQNQGSTINKRQAFLDLLLDINDEGSFKFTDEELLDETITFMIAGSDTTASSNCFAFTMLGLHQEIQEKVYAEIMDVIGPWDSVGLTHLPRLVYLEKVLKETLRLFPLAAFLVRTADANIDLGDFVVLKDCSIVLGILNVHRNPKYYPDPLKFDPDRFLPEEIGKRPFTAYFPFSYGPRNCIGMRYGMMAMKTLLATVLRRYKVNTSYKSVQDIELKTNLVLRPRDGYKVSFEERH